MVDNSEILEQIRRTTPYILDIRKNREQIEVKIPASPPYGWINLRQSTIECETVVKKYIALGYEIK